MAIGTANTQSGWAVGVTGDATFADIGFDDNTVIPFVDAANDNFTPLTNWLCVFVLLYVSVKNKEQGEENGREKKIAGKDFCQIG